MCEVVSGNDLAVLDTTGTLTQKYQARLNPSNQLSELISSEDTEVLESSLGRGIINLQDVSPVSQPQAGLLLPIGQVFEKLSRLIGSSFPDAEHDQERNRGAALHSLVCETLGYRSFQDGGQFPDVKHQLIEAKLQTSPTIDLSLVCPDDKARLDIESINGNQVRHCDVRYALFFANIAGGMVTITNFYLTTGRDFFTRFPQFGGRKLNKKIQIPLPSNFFDN